MLSTRISGLSTRASPVGCQLFRRIDPLRGSSVGLKRRTGRALIDSIFKELQPKRVTANVGALRTELRALDTKIARLTDAIENGEAVAPIVAKLQARQTKRDQLLAAIGAAEAMKQIAVDRPTVERRVLEHVTKWQSLLRANVANGRQALREVLDGPIRFTPDGKQYRFSGRDLTRQLVAGTVDTENSTLSGVPKWN